MGFRFQLRRSDGWAQGGAAPQKPINPEQRFGVISGFLGGDTDYRRHGVRTDSASTPPPGAGRAAVSAPVAFSATRALGSEEHTSELQPRGQLVCRLLLEKNKQAVAAPSPMHAT